MFQVQDLVTYGVWDFVVNVLIFAALAVPLFLLFWKFYKKKFQSRRIQSKPSNSTASIREEIKHSMVTLIIFTLVDVLIYLAQLKGYTKIYTNVNDYGWPYLICSVLIIIILHDTIYYFLHRLMHHPKIYYIIHKVHHESTDPSPFAAFSFHPLEALLEYIPYVIFAFLLPVHLVALWAWQIIQITFNIIAHLGYEIYPKGFNTHWLFRFKTPSTHHNMHHAKVRGNYGLYFTWWDKIFKTEFPEYNQTYEELQEKIAEGKTSNHHALKHITDTPFKITEKTGTFS